MNRYAGSANILPYFVTLIIDRCAMDKVRDMATIRSLYCLMKLVILLGISHSLNFVDLSIGYAVRQF